MKNIETIPHSKPWISKKDINSVQRVLIDGMIANGKETVAFENDFKMMTGYNFSKATVSGTSAIIVALKALDIGYGDEVIIPTYVCDSVQFAVRSTGAKEVLCDIGPNWIMTNKTIAKKISKKTKAIIAVHIFGIEVDSKSLQSFGVPIIEDCCQAFGRNAHGRWIGNIGDISTFSFHPTKCLSAGEGGLIATNNENIANKINDIKIHNKSFFNISDIQAALARSQLKRYDLTLKKRIEIAHKYFDLIPKINLESIYKMRNNSMFFRFPITHNGEFLNAQLALQQKGIHVRRGVDALLHRKSGLDDELFPNATSAYSRTISIPILPQLTEKEIIRVSEKITDFISKKI